MPVRSCQHEESFNVRCNVYCNEDYGNELLNGMYINHFSPLMFVGPCIVICFRSKTN